MMSNVNSPLLHRASPHRAESVDRGDAYQIEKDLVIGELSFRMKGRLPKPAKAGFDKNSRGETDEFDDGAYGEGFNSFRSKHTPEPQFAPRSQFEDEDDEEERSKVIPAKAVSSSASINPTRTSSAVIKLAPSPNVARRNRSKSPNKSNGPRMSRMAHSATAHAHLSNGHSASCGMNGNSSTASSSSSSRTSSGTRKAGPVSSSSAPTNRPTSTHRSISLQPSYNRPRGTAASASTNGHGVGPRKPLQATINGHARTNGAASSSGANGSSSQMMKLQNGHASFNRSISANPDLNDPAIQARIGNRATKVVQKSIGKCGTCNKAINEDGCTAFGKVYHKACFKCFACKQKITGKFFEKDGKPYCQKDFMKAQENCTVCKQPIKGDSVVSNNKVFHPECMKCYVCGTHLRGQYFTYQDKPICEMHYKQHADKCSVCHEVPTGRYFGINDDIVCESCHVGQSEKCPKCQEDVVGSKMVKITGAVFHTECFTCVVCKRSMAHAQFVADDKMNIYCPDDYNNKKAPKCSFCKKPIVPKEGERTAPRLRAMDRDFHPKCFQCEDCGLVLDSRVKGRECYPWRNHILCIKCNRKKFSSSESDDSSDEDGADLD